MELSPRSYFIRAHPRNPRFVFFIPFFYPSFFCLLSFLCVFAPLCETSLTNKKTKRMGAEKDGTTTESSSPPFVHYERSSAFRLRLSGTGLFSMIQLKRRGFHSTT